MIKKHIENMKTKSHAQKSSYAFFASLTLTGLIATVWFLTVFTNPGGYFQVPDDEVQNLANAGSLFDVVKEGFK